MDTKHWNRSLLTEGDTIIVAIATQYVVLEFTIKFCMCAYVRELQYMYIQSKVATLHENIMKDVGMVVRTLIV